MINFRNNLRASRFSITVFRIWNTYAMIKSLYKDLLKEGKKIFVIGDSAGGNISLGLMYEIKEEGLTKPDTMVLQSPYTNPTFSNPDIEKAEKTDPAVT